MRNIYRAFCIVPCFLNYARYLAIKKDLNWEPSITFEKGLDETVSWYLENQEWLDNVTSGAYQSYYKEQYQ